ncbi:transcription antitermination factor NusB [Anaeromassilibacillus sp. An200]|uniref:Transcription antitermination protein NusB n=1 Tax=Candidatus Caccousia stercoris TaxID=2840723 RepID=A0A9D1FRL3_9FIRM|nr:transcription antitermination factor NusB [Anaeromassilibacillus sp. An200]OUP08982.1 transcription antitermination factor NusB [Anaeromassilibacillus sp. An200]HIS78527.1 transcription antitermination factor NusB [Candidatus Caccousia stercoris]
MKRREARQQAFVLVFEQSFSHDGMEQIIDTAEAVMGKPVDEFASRLALGTEENLPVIDEKIGGNSRGWKLERLSKVSLAILRLAIYELLFEKEIPVGVTINEAIELAKRYGGEEDAPFVNGVLGTVAKECGEKKPKKDEKEAGTEHA